MNKHKQQYLDFEAYERVAEPHKRERASVWRTAIGLQDVDCLLYTSWWNVFLHSLKSRIQFAKAIVSANLCPLETISILAETDTLHLSLIHI